MHPNYHSKAYFADRNAAKLCMPYNSSRYAMEARLLLDVVRYACMRHKHACTRTSVGLPVELRFKRKLA